MLHQAKIHATPRGHWRDPSDRSCGRPSTRSRRRRGTARKTMMRISTNTPSPASHEIPPCPARRGSPAYLPVHHRRWRDDIGARLCGCDRLPGEVFQSHIVQHTAPRIADDAAMTMIGVFAKTSIGDHHQMRAPSVSSWRSCARKALSDSRRRCRSHPCYAKRRTASPT